MKTTNQDKTCICDSNLCLGRGLHEGAASKLSGHVHSLIFADHPFILQVTFVTNKNHGNLLRVFDTQDLLSEILKIVEGGLGSDAVDQDEALTILHVQISHGCELFLEQNILNSCLKQFQNSRPCIYSFMTFQKYISVEAKRPGINFKD